MPKIKRGSSRQTAVFLILLAATNWLTPDLYAGSHKGGVREIGSQVELFVDDWLIGRLDGVRLALHRPRPAEVVMDFNQAWEGEYSAYVTVFPDGDLFRMYYRGVAAEDESKQVTCYAESRDGIKWTRPLLKIHEFDGSLDNNIIWVDRGSHNFAPFKDSNPETPPEHRYKALAGGPLLALVSADGLHWKKLTEEPVISDGAFDSQNLGFWDPLRKQYVAFYRDFIRPAGGPQSIPFSGVRAIKTATSSNFVDWTEGQWLDYSDASLEHFYTNAITPYARAPHIYLGFPKRFVPNRVVVETDEALFQVYLKDLLESGNEKGIQRVKDRAKSRGMTMEESWRLDLFGGVSDAVLISSRDGLNFRRTFREAFVRAGLDQGNWGHRNNMTAWGILQTGPEELSIYLGEHYELPTCRLRRQTLRLDGFTSVQAGFVGGTLLTRPLTFTGRELVLNYSTSAVGFIKVELQDELSRPVPGFSLDLCPEIYGDQVARVVSWESGSDLSSLAGQKVRLKVQMKDADLYSIQFR